MTPDIASPLPEIMSLLLWQGESAGVQTVFQIYGVVQLCSSASTTRNEYNIPIIMI